MSTTITPGILPQTPSSDLLLDLFKLLDHLLPGLTGCSFCTFQVLFSCFWNVVFNSFLDFLPSEPHLTRTFWLSAHFSLSTLILIIFLFLFASWILFFFFLFLIEYLLSGASELMTCFASCGSLFRWSAIWNGFLTFIIGTSGSSVFIAGFSDCWTSVFVDHFNLLDFFLSISFPFNFHLWPFRYAGQSLRYSLTLGSTPSPAVFMRNKLLTILRLKCDGILLDLHVSYEQTHLLHYFFYYWNEVRSMWTPFLICFGLLWRNFRVTGQILDPQSVCKVSIGQRRALEFIIENKYKSV